MIQDVKEGDGLLQRARRLRSRLGLVCFATVHQMRQGRRQVAGCASTVGGKCLLWGARLTLAATVTMSGCMSSSSQVQVQVWGTCGDGCRRTYDGCLSRVREELSSCRSRWRGLNQLDRIEAECAPDALSAEGECNRAALRCEEGCGSRLGDSHIRVIVPLPK